jgi:hypothetical protein
LIALSWLMQSGFKCCEQSSVVSMRPSRAVSFAVFVFAAFPAVAGETVRYPDGAVMCLAGCAGTPPQVVDHATNLPALRLPAEEQVDALDSGDWWCGQHGGCIATNTFSPRPFYYDTAPTVILVHHYEW